MTKRSPKIDLTTAVVDMTYLCNDTCVFCFNREYLNRDPALSLSDIRSRLTRAEKKRRVNQVILTGGEPTLHPQFFDIMQHFLDQTRIRVSLNTNALKLADKTFAAQLEEQLASAKNTKRMFSLSLSTVDHYPAKTPLEKTKLAGLKNAMQLATRSDTHVVVVIAATKTNYKILPKLVSFIAKYLPDGGVISLRGLYLDAYMTDEQKKATVPTDWQEIAPYVTRAIKTALRHPRLKLRLFNLPLCYFRDLPELPQVIDQQKKFHHEVRLRIAKGKRTTATFFHGDTWQPAACSSCALLPVCNKIQQEFLETYAYPDLVPF